MMKSKLFCMLFLGLTFVGAVRAQVSVKVDGGEGLTLGTSGGIYFSNDSMRVVSENGNTSSHALNNTHVLTFQYVEPQGIAEAKTEKMFITPVPAHDYILLKGIGEEPQTLTIYSILGVKMLQQTVVENERVQISGLPNGAYLLRCGKYVSKMIKN